MGAGIRLREDYSAARLRALAKATRLAAQSRRLLALSLIYDGASRTEASDLGGVGLQTVRDWVLRFNAQGPEGLKDKKHPGPRPKLTADQQAQLVRLVEAGPIPAVDGVVRWRLKDLVVWIQEEFGVQMDETSVGRSLRAMGYRKLSARPRHHAQDPAAGAAFKKTSPRR